MRKHVIIVLLAMTMFSAIGAPMRVLADSQPSLTVSTVSAPAGTEATVSVVVSPNSNVTMVQFELTYDSEKLALISASAGNALSSPSFSYDNTQARVTYAWDDIDPSTNGGDILYITFHIMDDAEGTAQIWFNEEEDFVFADENMADLGCIKVSGAINILDILYGDVDINGEITLQDALLICNYKVGRTILSQQQLLAADVDADGSISLQDALMICNYKVGRIMQFPAAA